MPLSGKSSNAPLPESGIAFLVAAKVGPETDRPLAVFSVAATLAEDAAVGLPRPSPCTEVEDRSENFCLLGDFLGDFLVPESPDRAMFRVPLAFRLDEANCGRGAAVLGLSSGVGDLASLGGVSLGNGSPSLDILPPSASPLSISGSSSSSSEITTGVLAPFLNKTLFLLIPDICDDIACALMALWDDLLTAWDEDDVGDDSDEGADVLKLAERDCRPPRRASSAERPSGLRIFLPP
jgi:hypothetical protein